MKVIQIGSVSSSYFVKDYERDIYKWTWYARVANRLKKINPKLKVECWNLEKKYKKENTKEINGIKFRIFPTTFSIRNAMEVSFPMVMALKKEIEESNINNEEIILHLHEQHSWQNLAILFLLKNRKVKIVAQHHGGRSPLRHILIHKKYMVFWPFVQVLHFLEKLLFKKINLFYLLTDDEIKYIKKITPNSKIKFQTMGISEEYFKYINKNYARKELNLDKNKKYILYIGRLVTKKGIDVLLKAMNMLENKSGIKLLLMGSNYEKYEKQVDKMKNVKILGEIYGQEKMLYLSACDLLVLPSFTEGAPVVLMEAIAKNLPVVSTKVGGINKMIEDGREGHIIPIKNSGAIVEAIKKIIEKPPKNIKKYAYKYKWSEIIKNTVKDYENIK